MQSENSNVNSDLLKLLQRQMALQELKADTESRSSPENRSIANLEGDPNTSQGQQRTKKSMNKPKPNRPVIEAEVDDVEWSIF